MLKKAIMASLSVLALAALGVSVAATRSVGVPPTVDAQSATDEGHRHGR